MYELMGTHEQMKPEFAVKGTRDRCWNKTCIHMVTTGSLRCKIGFPGNSSYRDFVNQEVWP